MGIVSSLFGRETPTDPRLWHKWSPLLPVRLVDGTWSRLTGQVWRRQSERGWDYKQDEETVDEFLDRQI